MGQKIGIFGSAFDPPHQAHIEIIKNALISCPNIWVMPCFSHAFNKQMSNPTHRFNMINLALDGLTPYENSKVHLSSFQLTYCRDGSTYNLLKILQNKYDGCDISFSVIIGQDNADEITKWKDYTQLIHEFPFVVFRREGDKSSNPVWYKKSPHKYVDINLCPVSSTSIREDIKAGKEPKYVAPKVLEYIKQHDLYKKG